MLHALTKPLLESCCLQSAPGQLRASILTKPTTKSYPRHSTAQTNAGVAMASGGLSRMSPSASTLPGSPRSPRGEAPLRRSISINSLGAVGTQTAARRRVLCKDCNTYRRQSSGLGMRMPPTVFRVPCAQVDYAKVAVAEHRNELVLLLMRCDLVTCIQGTTPMAHVRRRTRFAFASAGSWSSTRGRSCCRTCWGICCTR